MNARTIILVILLLLVAVGGALQLKKRRPVSREPIENSVATTRPTIPLSEPTVRRLADGSFNPNPPTKPRFDDSPAGMPELKGWRERYRPILASRPSVGARLYVYPFLDRTKEGVGLISTYGSHLAASAALAHWTEARIVGAGPPERYGVPPVNLDNPGAAPTPTEWLAKARDDPAAAEAERLVVGVFEDAPNGQIELTVRLAPRAGGGADELTVLFQERVAGGGAWTRAAMEALQRRMLEGVADKLVELRVVSRRIGSPPMQLDLNDELSEIAALFDASDSWAAMDGIDRALHLAGLFHQDSMPIQAAAYGQTMLAQMMFDYGYYHHGAYEHALRAHALAQVAIAMDDAPWTPKIALSWARRLLNYDLGETIAEFEAADFTKMPPDLAALRHPLVNRRDPVEPADVMRMLPDWQVLILEKEHTFMWGQSVHRDFFNERHPHWRKRDFFAAAFLRMNLVGNYTEGGERGWAASYTAATMGMQWTVASEIAAMLVALNGTPEFAQLLEAALRAGRGADAGEIRRAAAAGEFHRAREQLLAAFAQWPRPSGAGHPGFELLRATAPAAEKIRAETEMHRAGSGFTGLEYSTAERVRFHRWLDSLGPGIEARHNGRTLGSFPALAAGAAPYLEVRPDNSAFLASLATYLDGRQGEGEDVIEWLNGSLQQAEETFPLEPDRAYAWGRHLFSQGERERGKALLVAFNRIEPFALTRHSKMAEFFRRYGYNADAVAALDKFLEINPNRYDLRNARNFRLCQMGREAEFHDKIKHEFSEAPQLLPGNLQFHVDNIFYLYNYARDFAGADLAAQAYMAIKPVDGRLQRASIEFAKSGDGRLAAAHLAPIDLDLYQGANLANMCCTLAQRYMKYGMIEEAVPLVERAASIDPWRGTVIYAMADLAFARKQYAEAMTHYQRFNERYGRSSLALRGLAKCYSAMGDADRAIRILESDTIDKAPEWANTESVADLMKLYADTGRAERARELADFIPQCAMREREEVKAALEAYRRIDAGRAEAMLGRLNEIMAGPSFWN